VSRVAAETTEERAVSVIKGLAMDAPKAAKSGHQGTAMALAPLAVALWTRIMRYDPAAPGWFDRDRFVLSAGHASILQYAALHLAGYDLTLDDLRDFRQWGSRTPGHPEAGHTAGVEVTTGPLGQGFANGVGMAIAEQHLRETYGAEVCDHRIYAICSDGDLQEGISHEAASLAGCLGLGRLVYVYDDNHISIDGPTELTFCDDSRKRFEAYGWHVVDLGEVAEDLDALEAGLRAGIAEDERPSLLVLRSHIAFPSPKFTDVAAAHGNPFDDDEIRATKAILGIPEDETFWVPPDVVEWFAERAARHREERLAWEQRIQEDAPGRAELRAAIEGHGLPGWQEKLPSFEPGTSVATRKASQACFNAALDVVPGLLGGGADLTENTGVKLDAGDPLSSEHRLGRQIHFGVREHAMASTMNGAAQHGGVLPVGGTFFIFSDYARPAIRLAALMQSRVIYSFSHDSVAVGEDGPTHQPVEQLASLRAIPGLTVVRPADANETVQAWQLAIDADGPVMLVLTRQDVPVLDGTATPGTVARGAYVLRAAGDGDSPADVVLIGTGSEVSVCVEAAERLAAQGIAATVVSMPSWEAFADQDEAYRASVLPPGVPRLSVEAGTTFGWATWADDSVGIDRFGASAPGSQVLTELGIEPDHVVARATRLVADRRPPEE
jgi:transketolase